MANSVDKERAIRVIVSNAVKSYANGFSTRHLAEVDNENGVINMKIHNVFIAALGSEIQYYSALVRWIVHWGICWKGWQSVLQNYTIL